MEFIRMNEIMDGKQRNMNQSQNKMNEVEVSSPSLEEDFNSTFTKLEAMQDEIVAKKIAELEESLSELEAFAMKIINER